MTAREPPPYEARAELTEELNARVNALHLGLAAVMDLLACAPAEHGVRAGTLQVLLAPLVQEAEQAAAAARLLAPQREGRVQ